MAKKVTVTLVDDFDGEGAADETVEFGLDGVTYEIDLSAKNATKLRHDLKQWVEASRRVGGRRRGSSSSGRGRGTALWGSDRKVGSPAGRPLQWKAGTAVSAPVPRMTKYRCEGEQVTANVRTFYGPCPQGGRPGARRGPDAQPQLHRHRAHPAGTYPRRRRGSG